MRFFELIENFADGKVNEVLDNPAPYTWSKDEFGFPTATAKDLGLHIAFDGRNQPDWEVSFYREQENGSVVMNRPTGQGKEFQVFATVNAAIKDFIKMHPDAEGLTLDARKDGGVEGQGRVSLYRRMMNNYAKKLGWEFKEWDQGQLVMMAILKPRTNENFADGKKKVKTQSPAQWQKAMIKKYGEDGWYDIADAVRDYYESNAILNNTISDIIKIKNDHPSFTDYSGITKLYRYEKKDKNSAPTDDTFIPFAYNIKGAKNFVQSVAQGNMGFKKSDFELVEKDFNPGDAILNFTNLIELVHNAEDDDGEWYKREYEVWMKRTPYYAGTHTNENFADGKKNEAAPATAPVPQLRPADFDQIVARYKTKKPSALAELIKKFAPNILIMIATAIGLAHLTFLQKFLVRQGIKFSQKQMQKAMAQVESIDENFADGKKKGKSRPGRVKRSGASCNGSVTALRKRAKNASGEKAKMYHWCANMKSGRKKK